MELDRLTRDFMETANDIYYCGMLTYESLCEKLLIKSGLSVEIQDIIQEEILDKAQILFEQDLLDMERSK